MSDVPENAPEHCPGVQSEEAGKGSACAGCPNQGICASGEARRVDPDIALIADRLATVKTKVLVLSGKGGVGKSTVTSSLARVLAQDPNRMVGVLDVDICGPSQPRMMGRESDSVHESGSGWEPVFVSSNLLLMSIGFLLPERGEAVIWRGPRKNGLIKQFLRDVDWGKLDILLIDTPPGTSDEHISIAQMLLESGPLDGALIVTTPQEISLIDVRKEINFCHKTKVPVLGVVENMSSFVCPHCAHSSELFPATTGGASAMCEELSLPLIARLPLDSRMAAALDHGEDFFEKHADSPLAVAFTKLANDLLAITQRL